MFHVFLVGQSNMAGYPKASNADKTETVTLPPGAIPSAGRSVCGADPLDQVMRLDPKLSQSFEILGEVAEPGCRSRRHFSSRLQVGDR
ncbi:MULTISPECIES: hypothetical protein [Sorangium]|uniref:hypothetical protein n=1 Tax=Sorangium TaxID=39643 RepID=UPI003D9C4813